MKKFILIFIAVFSITAINAQSYVTFFYDPINFGIVFSNHNMRMASEQQFINTTNKTNEAINRANENIAKFVVAKKKVHDALLNVNSLFKNAKQVKGIIKQFNAILESSDKLSKEIASAPEFAFLKVKYIDDILDQSIMLYKLVNDVAFAGGEKNIMMNYRERDALLRDISFRLHLINANINLMQKGIYYAKMDGFWKSANPFKKWINQDKRIIEGIIRKVKYI